MILIQPYRAIEQPEICEEYIKGHRQVLLDYNVIQITSNNPTWISNPDAYLLIARLESNNKIVGGIRVEIARGTYPLPIESAIGKLDNRIYDVVKKFAVDGGVGELCGLWNSKEIKGIGTSVLLTRSAISVINQLQFRTLVGICAEYTLKMFSNVGFVIDRTLGVNGEFPYPDDRYITRTLGILNTETLATAHPYDKERMESLRNKPRQRRLELAYAEKKEIEVEYDLIINDTKQP